MSGAPSVNPTRRGLQALAVREGWAEATAKLAAKDEGLVEATVPTRFDTEKWEWA
jgi:hypothetical protein